MPTGFEYDQYNAQVELVKAINRLAKAIEESNDIKVDEYLKTKRSDEL